VSEWRLWEGDEPPVFTQPEFFRVHPHIHPGDQVGHAERTDMAVQAVVAHRNEVTHHSLLDLGCGDGSFLSALSQRPELAGWALSGVDAGEANIQAATALGVQVMLDDFTQWAPGEIEVDGVISMNEVLEHLADPHGLLAGIRARMLVCTSPSAETPDWHYEHHAWAWDWDGYEQLLRGADWYCIWHTEVVAKRTVSFPPHGDTWTPRYQCVVGIRP
jgi:Methyltransferase domain